MHGRNARGMERVVSQSAAVSGNSSKRFLKAMVRASSNIGANLLSLVIFILIWDLASRFLHNPLFPGPAIVAQTFWTLLIKGDLQGITLFEHSYVSLFRVLLGFVAACFTAIPLGILLGLWKPLY